MVSNKEKVKFTLTKRQKAILPVVMIGAFFEGFDFMVISLALPFISNEYHLNPESTGLIVSIVAVGAMFAFFVVRRADRVGRKP
ncbi:MAG: MFS transporter, partial [Bacillota bacterium]|nr:MFS transporter [Bacillota bacterium]